MTETARTTITLSKGYMDLVDELIGVFGNTSASVITNIVKHFFNDSKNDALLTKLRMRKRKLYPPEDSVIKDKIFNLFKGTSNISLDDFSEYLELDKTYILGNLHIWVEKYKIQLENKIIKKQD